MSETEIRTDIPPEFHPGHVASFAQHFDVDHPMGPRALAAVTEGLKVAYEVAGAINDAEKQLRSLTPHDAPVYRHNGQLMREHGSEEQFASAAEKATQRALVTIERRVKELQSYETVLQTTVSATLDHPERKTPHGIAEASEIRAHVRSLEDTKRTMFLHEAVERGDSRTLAAVLHSPPYLSGLDAKEQQRIRSTAARILAPVESKLLDGTSKALDVMTRGAALLMQRTAEVSAIAAPRIARRNAALEKLAVK